MFIHVGGGGGEAKKRFLSAFGAVLFLTLPAFFTISILQDLHFLGVSSRKSERKQNRDDQPIAQPST